MVVMTIVIRAFRVTILFKKVGRDFNIKYIFLIDIRDETTNYFVRLYFKCTIIQLTSIK